MELEFFVLTWFVMLFLVGMGIGLVFWGVVELILYFVILFEGIVFMSSVVVWVLLCYLFFYWGLYFWVIYVVFGLVLVWFKFNCGVSGLISELLCLLFGCVIDGWLGWVVDILVIFVMVIGVVILFGFGVL